MLAIGFGINDGGQVVGAATLPAGDQHTILVDADGTVHDIAGLNGSSTSKGNAVDNAGRVVGQAWVDADGITQHAFKYSNGSLTDLDSFGSSQSEADGIADGTTVGHFTLADGVSTHAFVHTDADGTADLNTRIPSDSGWTLTKAHGISTSGRIVGEGLLNGEPHVFRLTPPVPPPPPPPPPGDTTAPSIVSLSATPDNIWPANGQWVTVGLSVKATDDSGAAPVCELTTITADEGSAADAKITAPLAGQVRALRSRHQDERVYTFGITCADKAGNEAHGQVNVTVAKNRVVALKALARVLHQSKCLLAQHRLSKGRAAGRSAVAGLLEVRVPVEPLFVELQETAGFLIRHPAFSNGKFDVVA